MRLGRFAIAVLACCPLAAQETRSMIYGRVFDPQGAAVAGAGVKVTNTDTNTSVPVATNETGYYEAGLLLPGNYMVSAEASGFKTSIRRGIVLLMSSRAEVNLRLELGALADSVTVVAEAPLLDAASASSGRVLDNRTQTGLPVSAANITIFARLSPGIQTNGEVRVLGPADQNSSSDYKVAGAVGGNEWSIDGAPNTGSGGRIAAHLPHADTISEMKVETSGFEASIGHTTGLVVALMSKAGTNQYHGAASNMHFQTRWNATPFFARQLYYRRIAEAEAAGDKALADRLRASDKQASGRKNHYAATIGGPVILPGVYNGKDRLFFFLSFTGYRNRGTASSQYLNYTFPTMADRRGDFSRHLSVDASRYQLYDPLSARVDAARAGHYIRDPIPGNILPASRVQNPAYNTYVKFLPVPNNDPADPRLEPRNNYIGAGIPQNEDYWSLSNRVDYQHSTRHRFFGRWTLDDNYLDALDWAYETYRGLMNAGNTRNNVAGIADWIWTPRAATVLNFTASMNEYRSGSKRPVPMKFRPSDVGFPAYMDAKAGDQHVLPYMSFSAYNVISTSVVTPTRFRTLSTKLDVSHIRGKHSARAGVDLRQHYRTGGGGGYTSGSFSFSNAYTRRNDDSFTPAGDFGHNWAAFMMGIPSGMSIATNDSYITHTPYWAWFVQDQWRLTPRLNLNLGLRAEYEMGPTERYNRMIGPFDAELKLPISEPAQAAYARRPAPERAGADFLVRGGSVYPGSGGASRRIRRNELMWLPRLAAAYQLNSSTVIRGGYGLFYDSLNAMTEAPTQTGFSRTTSTLLTTDFGATWLAGDPRNGVSPLRDPFPVRADGTRFDEPLRDALGAMAVAGRSFSFNAFATRRARQQRWRIGLQRQIGASMLLDVAYAGSYSDRVYISKNLSPLPEKYWADGMVRNDAVANNLNANVTNPFQLANFADLRSSHPLVYQDMSTLGFYTSATARKSQLLRAVPHMSGLTQGNAPFGEVRTGALEVSFERRFSKGFNLYAAYARLRDREADFFFNEFDVLPTWRESNDGRPHRLVLTGIWELPFGRGRALARHGLAGALAGGFQIGVAYEAQPGPLIDFGNLFYYGKLEEINTGPRTFDRWFNTANFERVAARAPASFHRRVFTTRVDGLRADRTNILSANLQRDFRILERLAFQLRVDVMNLPNRTQMNAPDSGPLSTNFGKVTQQSWTTKRYVQFTGRIHF
ncbi:MAG: carboxypeptidase-like regulatory domain-containing protein [Acidobacteriota bacterium]